MKQDNRISYRLGLVFHCQFFTHLHQFGGLRGFLKKSI